MKDNWLNKLIVAAVLFVAVILVGFLTMHTPALKYTLTPQQTLSAITNSTDQVSPVEAKQLLKGKDQSSLFVDIRNTNDFIKGHAEGALNIPLSDLLSEENLALIKQAGKDHKTIILYGTDHSQASAPWLLLKQLGFDQIKVLQGGYARVAENPVAMADSLAVRGFDSEAAQYNFAELGHKQGQAVQNSSLKTPPQKVVTKPVPKSKSPAAGGC